MSKRTDDKIGNIIRQLESIQKKLNPITEKYTILRIQQVSLIAKQTKIKIELVNQNIGNWKSR